MTTPNPRWDLLLLCPALVARLLIGVVALQAVLWVLFLSAISGDWENPMMFLPLPLFSLAVMVGVEINCWRARRQLAKSSSPGEAR